MMEINIKIDFKDEQWNRLPKFIQDMYVDQLKDYLMKFTLQANREITQYLFERTDLEKDAVD